MTNKKNTGEKPHHHSIHAHYRPDIDGLRAIAILLVVGFHAFPEYIQSGFIGVDVFFVISGFLISKIILENLTNNQFSFSGFYARRIKRIFPALTLVLLTSYLIGSFTLFPDELVYMGGHIVAGAGFLSNFLLWKTLGYFAPSIDKLPLMHLWSLSIEEQFYIVWPLLIWLFRKSEKYFLALLSLTVLLSFSANIYTVYGSTTAAFYSPLSRLWEIGSGGILACICMQRTEQSQIHATWQSVTGLLLLLLGCLLISKEQYFPGWWVLLPVTGTLLLISAGASTWINKYLLGHKLLVLIGLISYPLYLWHWPLLSFSRIMQDAPTSLPLRAVMLCVAFILAWLTWQYFEKPVRQLQGKRIIAALIALMLTLLAAGIFMTREALDTLSHQGDGMEFEQHWQGWSKCYNTQNCRILDSSKPVDIAVIGDSHAGHLADGLRDIVQGRKENIVVLQQAMCLPVYSLLIDQTTHFNCPFIDHSLDESIASPSIRTIILSGYVDLYILQHDETIPENPNLREVSSDISMHANMKHVAMFRQALDITLEKLSHSQKKIIFLVDTPELDFEPRECLSLRKLKLPMYTPRTPCAIERAKHEAMSAEYRQLVAKAESQFPSVKFIHTDNYLCDKAWCWGMVENQILYSDRNHLTPDGSRYLLNKIKTEILTP